MSQNPPTFVVEHLDPELGPWSALEYACIARESHATGARFMLSSVPPSLQLPADLAATQGLEVDQQSVEEIFADRKSKVCLLDPAAKDELSPADGEQFDVFLFGGILGALSIQSMAVPFNIQSQTNARCDQAMIRHEVRWTHTSPCMLPLNQLSISRSHLRIKKEGLCWPSIRPQANDHRHSRARHTDRLAGEE